MQGGHSASVCPSVWQTSDCDNTKETCAYILTPNDGMKLFHFYDKKNGWWGDPYDVKFCGQIGPVEATTPIFNRYSIAAPQL